MTERRTRPLIALGYLLALALIFIPLVELAANAYPPVPSAARWRFGFVGYLGNNILLPTFGLGVAVFTAILLEHRAVLKVLAILAGIGALGLIGTSGLFVLDALQVRAGVNPELSRSFDIATLKAGVAIGLAVVIFAWVALFGWNASRDDGSGKSERKRDKSKLVVSAGANREPLKKEE